MCWCERVVPISTRTRFVFLMHPYEDRHVKLNTGRLTHHCLQNSLLLVGDHFQTDSKVQDLIDDPENYPVLLYPGKGARDMSKHELSSSDLEGRRLVVFVLDGTWRLARSILKRSAKLQSLPKVMFAANTRSRYAIKKQPEEHCLSTLEATHELLHALERSGLDTYSQPDQLLKLFAEMQTQQIECLKRNRSPHFVPRDAVAMSASEERMRQHLQDDHFK